MQVYKNVVGGKMTIDAYKIMNDFMNDCMNNKPVVEPLEDIVVQKLRLALDISTLSHLLEDESERTLNEYERLHLATLYRKLLPLIKKYECNYKDVLAPITPKRSGVT